MAENESSESPVVSAEDGSEMMEELKHLSKSELSDLSRAVQLKIDDMNCEVCDRIASLLQTQPAFLYLNFCVVLFHGVNFPTINFSRDYIKNM